MEVSDDLEHLGLGVESPVGNELTLKSQDWLRLPVTRRPDVLLLSLAHTQSRCPR